VSSKAYETACELVRNLATTRTDLQVLMNSGINPFFMIYAFADCGIPLPNCFSRELLWKHLDAILEAQCWRGLGSSHAYAQNSRGTRVAHVSSNFCQKSDDPEGIIGLLTLTRNNVPFTLETDSMPVHKLNIVITDNHWVANGHMGTIWYEAQELEDEDVASFAMIDTLTRFLPHCRGGILEVRSNNVRLLWGVCGAPSGAWPVVMSICHSHDVFLRGKWDELKGLSPRPYAHLGRGSAPVPARNAEIVNRVMEELGILKGTAAYGSMASHLMR